MLELIHRIDLENGGKSSSSIAFNETYVAYTINEITIALFDYTESNRKEFCLEGGHYNEIKFLKFSNNSKKLLLFSCSIDYVICWNIDKIIESGENRGNVITKNLKYEPVHLAFHPSDEFVMVCSGNLLCFYDVKSGSSLGEIKCKDFVNSAEFCLFNPDLIAVVNSQSACMNIFKYSTAQQVFSVKCEQSTPYMNICTLLSFPLIITTSSNGYIFVYDATYSSEKPPNLIKSISLKKLYHSYFYKNFSEAQDTEVSMLCMGIKLLTVAKQSFMDDQFKQKFIIACATPICVFFIDLDSADVLNIIDFKLDNFNIMPQLIEFHQIGINTVNLALVSLFQSEIDILSCSIQPPKPQKSHSTPYVENDLSVLTQEMLLDDSPLKEELTTELSNGKKPLPSMQEYLKTAKYLPKKDASPLKDKPITFTSKVKSSGYNTVAPKQKPFQPKINKSAKTASLSHLQKLNQEWPKKPNASAIEAAVDLAEKPAFEFELPNKLHKKLDITDHAKSIFLLKFSDDGRIIASGQADNMVHCLYADNIDKNSIVFNGHKDFIKAIDISHDGKYLISAGNDRTCKLWSLRKPNELVLDLPKGFSTTSHASPQLVGTKDAFKKDIAACNFFYMDKFLLISNENKLFLYNYHIDTDKPDIQSYINNSICKLVKTLDMTYSQSITCTSAINSFYSYMVFCGGTDKSLEVFDLNKCQSSLIITEAHSRSFHQIHQNSSEHNQHSYDLFLTSSIGDGIKFWDLRTARCVKRFDQHVSRALACKLTQSSCGNYIATGSEDRSTYVYDVRMNGVVQKFGGFTDTVTAVAFHPKKPELFCGTLDGKLFQFKKI